MRRNRFSGQRRRFLKSGSIALTAAALGSNAALGADKVSEGDAMAKSLGYHVDAKKVDAKKYATYKPGEDCDDCRFFQGKKGEAWGPCQIFQGKLVSAHGWCTAFVKKA